MSERKPWFRRLGDVPGITYASPGIDRCTLTGHNAEPVVTQAYEWEGERHEIVAWRWPGGSSQGPPARQHALPPDEQHTADELIRNLHETLELPGELSDYHFAIAGCAGRLWRMRRERPELLEAVEQLYWLDIDLVEAHPEAVAHVLGDDTTYYAVPAYESLISLYETQGYVEEALAVAERGRKFGHGDHARERLESKLEALEAEEDD